MDTFTIDSVDLCTLEAAAQFASTDEARGVITTVAMLDAVGDRFYVATDSYVLGLVTPDVNAQPLAMINAVKADPDYRTAMTLVPASLVRSAYKALPKRKTGLPPEVGLEVAERNGDSPAGSFEARFTIRDVGPSKVLSDRVVDGEFPNFASLFTTDQPLVPEAVSFAPDKLTPILKAAQLLTANGDDVMVTYFGQRCGNDKMGDPLKAGYWYATGEHGTLLALAMPIRVDRSWS